MLKKAFELQEIKEETYLEGFFSGKATKYFIPEESLKNTITAFPFLKNALKAGLISKDKKTGEYYTTDVILATKTNDRKKSGKKQFFSINGDDAHERTTLQDALVTLNNLRYIATKFGVTTDQIKFTVRYENGNPAKVVNYVELDKKLFGNSDDEVEENINKLNSLVRYERKPINEEITSVA